MSDLPMNVYAVVGGNGNGKSYKINQIISEHMEGDNKFSQILHFSLSPFDNIINDGIRKEINDKGKDSDGEIIYEKVGFVSVKYPPILEVLKKTEALALSDVKKYLDQKSSKYLVAENTLKEGFEGEISIKESFSYYIQNLLIDLIASEDKLKMWGDCLNFFTFESWVDDIINAFQDRNMLKNYLFFEKELENLSFDDMKHLSNGIEKLIYIDIALEKGKDDPQKIFESLNSTGLDLSQGDLIRNYILMDLERGEQNRIYKEIWIPIENNCKVSDGSEITSYVSDFIRDYLTLKTEKISSKPKVFETFKTYYEKENDEKLEDMKKYSEAYSYIIKPSLEKDRDIQRELDYLKSLDKTVINTFLIGILKDYKDNILEKDELVNMLILLQSYLWRRYITEKPTNALNKIFQGMYGKISRSGNYYENLVDVLMAEDGSVMTEKGTPILQRISGKNWVNNHAHVLEPIKNHSCKLLMLLLKDALVMKLKTGSIQMKINQENMNKIVVPAIPLELLFEINQKLEVIDKQQLNLIEENKQLTQLRDWLLPMLMNGQVKVE